MAYIKILNKGLIMIIPPWCRWCMANMSQDSGDRQRLINFEPNPRDQQLYIPTLPK
jgi:hypothetical protein